MVHECSTLIDVELGLLALDIDAIEPGGIEAEDHLRVDPRRVKLGGLFASDGHRLAGNVENLPPSLPADGAPHTIRLVRVDALGQEQQTARAVARRQISSAPVKSDDATRGVDWVHPR